MHEEMRNELGIWYESWVSDNAFVKQLFYVCPGFHRLEHFRE